MTVHPHESSSHHPLLEFVLHHLQVQVNVCTFTVVTEGYVLPMRTVPDWNFIFNCQGKLVWEIDGQAHPLAKGDLVIVPPGVSHRAWSTTAKTKILSIHVMPMLPDGQDAFVLLPPPRLLTVQAGSRLMGYLKGASDEWTHFGQNAAPTCRLYQAGWARLIVLELLREHCRIDPAMPTVDPLILDILKLLEKHACQTVTLPTLAKAVGYTAQHVNRLFSRVLGVTPLQYHRRLKIEKAAQMLAQTALSVQGVASEVGIEDAAYFSRLFSQHFGQSPQTYRNASESPLRDQA